MQYSMKDHRYKMENEINDFDTHSDTVDRVFDRSGFVSLRFLFCLRYLGVAYFAK
jgi:hypothetical protein